MQFTVDVGFFWVHAKNVRRDFGQTNSEIGIFWGIKYEPLLDPPSQSLKYLSGAPGLILLMHLGITVLGIWAAQEPIRVH